MNEVVSTHNGNLCYVLSINPPFLVPPDDYRDGCHLDFCVGDLAFLLTVVYFFMYFNAHLVDDVTSNAYILLVLITHYTSTHLVFETP